MWTILKEYLSQLPNAMREREVPDGPKVMECVYTPHSLRGTAATLLLNSGVDIMKSGNSSANATSPPPRFTRHARRGFAQDAALSA